MEHNTLPETMREELKRQAAEQMERYPQYRGHFSDYKLVKVLKSVKTKAGLAFEAGELAIAHPSVYRPEMGPYTKIPFMMVWSMRNQCDTSVRMARLQVLE